MFKGLFRLLQRLIDLSATVLVILLTLGVGGFVFYKLFELALSFYHDLRIQIFCAFLMTLVAFLMLWIVYVCIKHIRARL